MHITMEKPFRKDERYATFKEDTYFKLKNVREI
jgi:hypothetical protein